MASKSAVSISKLSFRDAEFAADDIEEAGRTSGLTAGRPCVGYVRYATTVKLDVQAQAPSASTVSVAGPRIGSPPQNGTPNGVDVLPP